MFEIISYGGGGFLQSVLNGVAMFFGSDNYVYALRMAATLAMLGILMNSAFTGRFPDLRWMFGIILIYICLFVPKVDVTVTDTVERTPGFPTSTPTVRVVSNVPIGLAFVAAFNSHMKDYFTQGVETVFALPTEINYRKGGPAFAQGIMESGLNAAPKDPSLNTSLANFWKDCVFYDIALGYYSMTDLAKADNLQAFLGARSATNRMYEHVAKDGSKSFQVCADSIQSGLLAQDLQADLTEQYQWTAFFTNFSTKPSAANTNSLVTTGAAAMPVALQYLTGMSMSSSQMLGQTTLANSFASGLVAFSSQADAQTVMQGYTAAKAEQERSLSFAVMGRIAGRMLPLINIIAEGLIYAVFPIVGLMLMFPGAGKVLLGYVIALVWIALWAPLYAVFHYFSMYFTSISGTGAAEVCNALNSCTPHLNMYTITSIKQAMANAANIAGYFATLVPYVAYMLVSRSGAMMAGVVGRAMDGYAQPVGHAATEAAGGNVSAGALSWQNQTAFKHATAPANSAGYAMTDNGAFSETRTDLGPVVKQHQSELAVSATFSQAAQASTAQAVEQATTRLSTATSALAQARAAEWREAHSHGEGGSVSLSSGGRTNQGASARLTDSLESVSSRAREFAEKQGWSDREVKSFVAALEGRLGLGGSAGPLNGGLGGSMSGTFTKTDEESKAFERADRFLVSEQGRHALQSDRDAGYSSYSDRARGATETEGHDRTAASSQVTRAERNYQAALQEMETARSAQQYLQSHGSQLSVSETNALAERVVQHGGNWQKGLDDLSKGREETPDAQKVSAVITAYYSERQQKPGFDFDAERDAVRHQGQLEQQAHQGRAQGQVAHDRGDTQARVGLAGLQDQGKAAAASMEQLNKMRYREEWKNQRNLQEQRDAIDDSDRKAAEKRQQEED